MSYVPATTPDAAEAENLFYLRAPAGRIGKLIAHYELYKEIVGRPGAVVEIGVYKGASLMRFATFRNLLETDASRSIFGFDAFGAFPRSGVESASDKAFIERFEDERGEGIARDALARLLQDKGMSDIHLEEGNIFDTLPRVLQARPELRIALLHLDVDVYEPTAFALDQLLPHITPGGLILFDDYGLVDGATRAADELVTRMRVPLEKTRFYAVPAFVRMPA